MSSLLLDTHVLLWWLADEPIDPAAHDAIAAPTNQVYVSAASIWEATIKQSIGKLDVATSLADATQRAGFTLLAISATHAECVGTLADHHRDPFDRLLIAQALIENLTLVTRDRMIVAYGVPTLRA